MIAAAGGAAIVVLAALWVGIPMLREWRNIRKSGQR